jgi:hypothetical protein
VTAYAVAGTIAFMVWFLHISEDAAGQWACSHGRRHLDTHDVLEDAIAHLHAYATTMTGAVEVMVHRLSGDIENLGPLT